MTIELDHDGPTAPPRDNGDVVFDAPWQSRAFGLAASLIEQQRFTWADFQTGLIGQVAGADRRGDDTADPAVYWLCWLETLGALSIEVAVVDGPAWSARCVELAARPAGHDHSH